MIEVNPINFSCDLFQIRNKKTINTNNKQLPIETNNSKLFEGKTSINPCPLINEEKSERYG